MSIGRFSGAVLTGGGSRRMGVDKAFIEIDGVPLAVRAARALAEAGSNDVFTVGGEGSRLLSLGLCHVRDGWPGEGPLGGLITALGSAENEIVVVLATDLAQISAGALRDLALACTTANPVAVPGIGGPLEVLQAAYRRSLLPLLSSQFERGERSIFRSLALLGLSPVRIDVRVARDLDTPEDLAGFITGADDPAPPAEPEGVRAPRERPGTRRGSDGGATGER